MNQHHPHHHGPHASHSHVADVLDLDAHVLQDFIGEVLDWTAPFAGSPKSIADLGAGTGTWTVALAERFTDAEVTAVDISEEMLTRVHTKADEKGVADRVRTLSANLDDGTPDLRSVDLAWAALSLHEVSHPEQALANIYDMLSPGGVLTIIEMVAPPTFLPSDIGLGEPGLEDRIREAEEASRAGKALHPEWGPRLKTAGFESVAERSFSIDPTPPYPESAVRYAETYLRRIRTALDGSLSLEDRATLDALLSEDGEHSLRHRTDLEIRGSRTTWVVRRP